tara:strand:- start:216 stop:515 length:300 start_codon:yes stop_codon:yes gene_type:complete
VALSWLKADEDGVYLTVRVQPQASQTAIVGLLDNALKIRLTAPPLNGGANEALVAFLAKQLQRPKSSIKLSHGHHNRIKSLWIQGVDEKTVRSALGNIE